MISRFRVYFGGSYFPPHRGHDEMLVSLLKNPDVAYVHLVPTFQNPLKDATFLSKPTAVLKRELIEAWKSSLEARAVEGLAKLRVEWREIDLGHVSYTVDTLAELLRESVGSGENWALCIGDDSLPDLGRWKEVDRLLRIVKEVWVFRRGPRTDGSFMTEVPDDLRKLTRWRLLVPEIHDVSSTEIRKLLEGRHAPATQERLKALLCPEVLNVL
ncbi:MAG: nicotinate-nicotinamide nucleotide adenylyltransferase [Bdellovibrionota bacterium]